MESQRDRRCTVNLIQLLNSLLIDEFHPHQPKCEEISEDRSIRVFNLEELESESDEVDLRIRCKACEGFNSKLREVIDESQLLDFLGGSCSCTGKGGCTRSEKGPWQNQAKMMSRGAKGHGHIRARLEQMRQRKTTWGVRRRVRVHYPPGAILWVKAKISLIQFFAVDNFFF
ncbi:hypothetical protein Droror1_Dr00018005 [Drosera rotundifolia]